MATTESRRVRWNDKAFAGRSVVDKRFSVNDVELVGSGLNRPECVLASRQGDLFTPDWTMGIARIHPDGTVSAAVAAPLIKDGFLPNGIALMPDGSFLFANLGAQGGVWRVGASGPAEPFLLQAGDYKIPPTNFVLVDGDRVWITVSAATRGHAHFSGDEKTGTIVLVEKGSARIVADGLTWTNELRISPDGQFLFVNETFACRTTRFRLAGDGSLTDKTHIDYPPGVFPDGMAFDVKGGLWIICPVSNRIIRLLPDLSWSVMFEDCDPSFFDEMSAVYAAGKLTRDMIVNSRGSRVSNLSSIAFGGPDLRTVFLGSLTMPSIAVLRSPVAGIPMEHWNHA